MGKFLIIFILLIVILSWFFRMIMGYFARNFFNINGQTDRPKTQRKTSKKGDVNIDKQPARDKKIKDNVGEYVDYEDIK